MHNMCNREINLETFTSQDTYRTTKIAWKDLRWHLWSDTTIMRVVHVFHGISQCIYSWSHVCLLSIQNHAFAKFITQVIRLKSNFPEHWIHYIRLDNDVEFSSRTFNNYCMSQGIQVQHSVTYVHSQNGFGWISHKEN
jgi:hypothetical protein